MLSQTGEMGGAGLLYTLSKIASTSVFGQNELFWKTCTLHIWFICLFFILLASDGVNVLVG